MQSYDGARGTHDVMTSKGGESTAFINPDIIHQNAAESSFFLHLNINKLTLELLHKYINMDLVQKYGHLKHDRRRSSLQQQVAEEERHRNQMGMLILFLSPI